MTIAELFQVLSAVGTLVTLLVIGWKVSQWFARLSDNVAQLNNSVKRVEIRMRGFRQRLEKLEDEEKPQWR